MLLENKNAIIYGGGGSIGGAVAKEFAREGAKVFLAGRTREKLEAVAERIRSAGGAAETAQVDALDEKAVDEHADAVAREAGGIDVSFNLISYPSVHGTRSPRWRSRTSLTRRCAGSWRVSSGRTESASSPCERGACPSRFPRACPGASRSSRSTSWSLRCWAGVRPSQTWAMQLRSPPLIGPEP
jgi:hypothetical protein